VLVVCSISFCESKNGKRVFLFVLLSVCLYVCSLLEYKSTPAILRLSKEVICQLDLQKIIDSKQTDRQTDRKKERKMLSVIKDAN